MPHTDLPKPPSPLCPSLDWVKEEEEEETEKEEQEKKGREGKKSPTSSSSISRALTTEVRFPLCGMTLVHAMVVNLWRLVTGLAAPCGGLGQSLPLLQFCGFRDSNLYFRGPIRPN
jgi:hypothetical protein